MMNQQEIIENEEEVSEKISEQLDTLTKKWFKTSSTLNLMKFLENYLEVKDKFINELKRL